MRFFRKIQCFLGRQLKVSGGGEIYGYCKQSKAENGRKQKETCRIHRGGFRYWWCLWGRGPAGEWAYASV